MADPYVIFPGTAGNYLSTPDVNLLDADTAHLQQSLVWADFLRFSNRSLGAVLTPVFGTLHGVAESEGGADSWLGTPGSFPVSADTEYTFSVSVASSVADRGGALRMRWFDSGSGLISTAPWSTLVALSTSDWARLSYTLTAPATAAFADLQIRYDVFSGGDVVAGDLMYWDAACLRAGSDPAFVPSLRIVGTLYEEIIPADMPIVFAADGTPLTVGDGWAGDGYSYHRYDGADASAPLVASFQAGDVPVAAQLPA